MRLADPKSDIYIYFFFKLSQHLKVRRSLIYNKIDFLLFFKKFGRLMGNLRAHTHTHTWSPWQQWAGQSSNPLSRQGKFFPVSHNSHLSSMLLCLFPYYISCVLPGGPESETFILLDSLVRSWSHAFILLRMRRPREQRDWCKVAQVVDYARSQD